MHKILCQLKKARKGRNTDKLIKELRVYREEFMPKLQFLHLCDVSVPKRQRSKSQEGMDSSSLLTFHHNMVFQSQ